LNEQETSDILKILVAADELLLQEIVDYLQRYLIENKSEWIEQHFELVSELKSFKYKKKRLKRIELSFILSLLFIGLMCIK
jgi:hypothetical protein